MREPSIDRVFAGSIPEFYDRYIVPLIFEPYATDLAGRVELRQRSRLLEIAAGTGVVTRALARTLPESASIVATDLNQAMIDHAARVGTARPVEWRQADAMQLPFADASFDAVVCQFGAMFFPDKSRAYSEVRRVLRRPGVFLFNVWDRIEENDFADTIMGVLAELFPNDPPRFMARTPHGYHDLGTIACDVANAGFEHPPRFETVVARSRAASAREVAIAYCQGTPWRSEIEARNAGLLEEATAAAEKAIAQRFGAGEVEGKIQAHIITIER